MASQVLSGATNASYTNNTGQNVRLIINYMSNVTSMTWADVTVTASSTTIGKSVPNVITTTSSGTITVPATTGELNGRVDGAGTIRGPAFSRVSGALISLQKQTSTIDTTTTTSESSGNFPVELMLANGQSFSAICGAYNIISIKEDGT